MIERHLDPLRQEHHFQISVFCSTILFTQQSPNKVVELVEGDVGEKSESVDRIAAVAE